jgi:HNH endonuclease
MSRISYPYKTVNGVKDYLHRHVMAEHLGRPLEPFEHVYHLDGDSYNNEIENLVIIKKNSHQVFTKKGKKNTS